MRTKMVFVGLLAVSMVAVACGPSADVGDVAEPVQQPTDVGSDDGVPPPDPEPSEPSEPSGVLVGDDVLLQQPAYYLDVAQGGARSANLLGFDMHQYLLSEEGGNVITSPVSVATFFAMVAAGSGGQTQQQILDVLGMDVAQDRRFVDLQRALVDTDDVEMNVANSLWANETLPVNDEFVRVIDIDYDGHVETLDLGSHDAVDAVDSWVEQQTNGMIPKIAEPIGLPSSAVVVAIVNAMAFEGQWSVPFDPDRTSDKPFMLTDGTAVDVPTMHNDELEVPLVVTDQYEAVRLPYGDEGRFVMDVVVAADGVDAQDMAGQVTSTMWDEVSSSLSDSGTAPVAVQMPTFTLEWGSSLIAAAEHLGVDLVFSDRADLSPMSPAADRLDTVEHATFVEVSEEGTRAAAVTGGAVTTDSVGPVPHRFVVDETFTFVISDQMTGAALMVGTVMNPTG